MLRGRHFPGMSEHSRLLFSGARWRGKVPVPVLHALGWKCVGVWSITMVATHLPQKACDAHVIIFTRPSSHLTNSFFPASKIVIAEESEREGLGTRLEIHCTDVSHFHYDNMILLVQTPIITAWAHPLKTCDIF